MKHIRLFDAIEYNILNVKDYFIDEIKNSDIYYYLWKVNYRDVGTRRLKVQKLYSYHSYMLAGLDYSGLEKHQQEIDSFYNISLDNFDIIFQSDNLDEVLDELKLLADIKKYNL